MEKTIKPRIYTVATSHLDTSWNWDLETTIGEYIPKTLKENFELFEKYPDYTFSFEGSYRYELMKEYYPEEFEKLKEYIASGRWNVTGSAYENGDVNIPSPEALFRNILYGNDYFDKTFGKRSVDIFLPDCFGFGYALPSVIRHANLMGFTTQKLVWSSAYHIPFDLGKWKGVDGNYAYASFDAMNYTKKLFTVRKYHAVNMSLAENMLKYSLPFTYVFHGVGDRGGAPKEASVAVVCKEISKNKSSCYDVLSAPADQVFRDMNTELSARIKEKLPVFDNELVSTDHGVGSYTSRAVSKRWNRRCERLADAAERAAVSALICAGAEYPQENLNTAWKRFIAHQFHDDITGTSLVKCYQRNWNDYILSLNQFSEEYRASSALVSNGLDTSFAKGIPLIVSNPVQSNGKRKACAEAVIELAKEFNDVEVYDSAGNKLLSGIVNKEGGKATVVFACTVPSSGYAVYDIRPSKKKNNAKSDLKVSLLGLENEKYKVKIDSNGDICSVFDKSLNREALSAPLRFAIHSYNGSISWPAWELDYKEVMSPARMYAASPSVEILEDTAARVALKITQTAGKSKFVRIVSLESGGEYVSVQNEVDWQSSCSLLKVELPLSVSNPRASFDLGFGNIKRSNNNKMLYEMPAQMWADISDVNGIFGVSVFSDSKTGWDKPNNNTLRITAIHSPKYCYRFGSAQHMLDFGINRFGFAIYTHKGSVSMPTALNAEYFNQPVNTFVSEKHKGNLGSEFSLCSLNDVPVIIRCVKRALNSDEIIVRVNEIGDTDVKDACFTLFGGIESAREVFASEENLCPASVRDGKLYFDIGRFGIKTFAISPAKSKVKRPETPYKPMNLPYNASITTAADNYLDGILPEGLSLPAELFPKEIESGSQSFILSESNNNALRCKGQKLDVKKGAESVCIIAACINGDVDAEFLAGKEKIKIRVSDMLERVGIWDMICIGEAAHIKKDTLAWNATHMHNKDGDVFAKYAYLFKYKLDLPKEVNSITLPDNENIFILAANTVTDETIFNTANELYDSIERRELRYIFTDTDEKRAKPKGHEASRSRAKFLKTYVHNRFLREISIFKK